MADENRLNFEAGGSRFSWNEDEGSFLFEEEGAILFWINSAFKTFLDTIEEVAGDDAGDVVLETTGYRMGEIVGKFFRKEGQSPEEVMRKLPDVYASAGWGKLEVEQLSSNNVTARLRMTNSWEYQVNKQQKKNKCGTFIPGHWAGVLGGLFDEHIDYHVLKSQVQGDPYCEFEFFTTNKTITENIHEFTRRKEQEEIDKLEKMVAERTKDLSDLLKEISSPIIPVFDQITVIPLLGKYDEKRAKELLEKAITELPRYEAKYVILDLTGLYQDLSDNSLTLLKQMIDAAYLIGMKAILVGVAPLVSMKMTRLDYRLENTPTFSTLQQGIRYALGQEHMVVGKI